MAIVKEFRDFLIKDNALALAIGVIIGASMGGLVGSITNDLIMPLINVALPPDADWKTWGITLGADPKTTTLKIGSFFAALVNLVIIGFVCFILVKTLVPKKKEVIVSP